MERRIYLDNAATSWPKPDAVYHAVDDYQRRLGAPAGRGVYRQAIEVERRLEQTRTDLARLIGAEDPRQVLFAYSGTDALMLAIQGLLHPGDHVVTTVCEHNAVLRPCGTWNNSINCRSLASTRTQKEWSTPRRLPKHSVPIHDSSS